MKFPLVEVFYFISFHFMRCSTCCFDQDVLLRPRACFQNDRRGNFVGEVRMGQRGIARRDYRRIVRSDKKQQVFLGKEIIFVFFGKTDSRFPFYT